MLSTISNFYKRHKKKIWVTGFLAGTAYAVGSYCLTKYDQWKTSKMNEVWVETKKRHHFESNQSTCTSTFMELLPNLRSTITQKLDIENFLDILKTKPPNKLDIWEKLKIYCFVQIICSTLSSALLLVFLKVQLNIFAGYLFIKTVADENDETKQETNELKIKYLSNVRYLIDTGVAEMLDDCQDIVYNMLKETRLDEKISHEKLKDIIKTVVIQMKKRKSNVENETKHSFCKYLIDPNWLNDSFAEDDNVKMTSQMVDILNGTDSCRVIESITNDSIDEIIVQSLKYFPSAEDLEIESVEAENKKMLPPTTLPIAKLIPKLNHHIHEIFKDGRNDFLDKIYANPLLRQFTENIYEAFSQEYT